MQAIFKLNILLVNIALRSPDANSCEGNKVISYIRSTVYILKCEMKELFGIRRDVADIN